MSTEGNLETDVHQNEINILDAKAAVTKVSSMYEIPGQDTISPHAHERYQRAKTRWDKEISNLVIEQRKQGKLSKILGNTNYNEWASVIKRLLNSDDSATQVEAAEHINWAPDNEIAGLIRDVIKSDNLTAQVIAAKMIKHAPESSKIELQKQIAQVVRTNLESNNSGAQIKVLEMIRFTPNSERENLHKLIVQKIQLNLNSDNLDNQLRAIEMIGLESIQGFNTQILGLINRSNPAAQLRIIKNASLTDIASEQNYRELVSQQMHTNFESSDISDQVIGAQMIQYATVNERADIIQEVINGNNNEAQVIAAMSIQYALEKERPKLRELVTQKIKAYLESGDPYLQTKAVEMIEYASETNKAELFELAKKSAPNALVAPPAYKGSGLTDETFARAQFDKGGSETTLIGGALKDKIIVRSINPEAFTAWQNLFENAKLWQNYDFDYVPIEPIVSYRINDQGLVDVFSGVLDLNLQQWKDRGGNMLNELEADRQKILDTMAQAAIKHGHTHDENFCLRFYRDENGRVDLNRKPRIYLIDFDQATSGKTT